MNRHSRYRSDAVNLLGGAESPQNTSKFSKISENRGYQVPLFLRAVNDDDLIESYLDLVEEYEKFRKGITYGLIEVSTESFNKHNSHSRM